MYISFASPFELIPIFVVKLSYTPLAKYIFLSLSQVYRVSLHFLCMVSFWDNYGNFGMLSIVDIVKFDWFSTLICVVYMYWVCELIVRATMPFDFVILFNLQKGKKRKKKR